MITASIEELYDAVGERGRLNRLIKREEIASDARFHAGIAAQPVVSENEPVSGFAPTMPERREVPRTRSTKVSP